MNGQVVRHENFGSTLIPARHVDVWLPPTYSEATPHNVLYMHDGQNLFYEEASYGGDTWGIDEILPRLINEGQIPDTIVVGIWNGDDRRWAEYLPQRPFLSATPDHQQMVRKNFLNGYEPYTDDYLKFLVSELKPFIDQTYATSSGREHTFIMGSSMGGLISLYAVCEYPHIFAGAGCLSTHWIALDEGMLDYMKTAVSSPAQHKFYFDFGTEGVDSLYEPHQQKVDQLMQQIGYTQRGNVLTQKFEGHTHYELAWRERLHIPLQFLMGS